MKRIFCPYLAFEKKPVCPFYVIGLGSNKMSMIFLAWGFVLVFLALGLAYWRLLSLYVRAWETCVVFEPNLSFEPRLKISVLVAARNEAANIEATVRRILAQDYPMDLLELWVVDDHSTDETLAILRQIQDPRLRVLDLAQAPATWQPQLQYKKRALAWALAQARGELIVCTDADCQPAGSYWLRSLAEYRHLYPEVECLAGPVLFQEEGSLWERCQSLDFTGMMLITAAGIKTGRQHLGNGANLAYTPGFFAQVQGYEGISHLASGDDMLLLQKMAERDPQRIAFIKSREAVVLTKAEPTVRGFWQQRLRWASKSGAYRQREVQFSLALVWLWALLLLLGWPMLYFWPSFWPWLLLGWLTKAWADYQLLSRACRFFGRPDLMRIFLPALFWHTAYIALIGSLSLIPGSAYHWKGRNLR